MKLFPFPTSDVVVFVRNLPDGVDGGDQYIDRVHGVGAQTSPLLSARAPRSIVAPLRSASPSVRGGSRVRSVAGSAARRSAAAVRRPGIRPTCAEDIDVSGGAERG